MVQHCQYTIIQPSESQIKTLGPAKIVNPNKYARFVDERDNVLVQISKGSTELCEAHTPIYFENAGPREHIYFDASKAKCAIVTCGGLCPGLNDVIRAIVATACREYDVAAVFGIKYGLEGFIAEYGHDVVELTPDSVNRIHEFGGTVLGSSRGPQSAESIVDALERMNISILFMIGGDGSMRAASNIVAEIEARQLSISVVGLPKTIDNDINFASPSFGFDTAVEKATEAIRCANVEARGAPYGVGLVKVMGRNAGFIAAQCSLACQDVDFVLIPEDDFELDGPNGFLVHLEKRVRKHRSAVVVVAEGAGEKLLQANTETDASGNARLGDIAGLLRTRIKEYFKEQGLNLTLKYIDPSYIIRSVPANSNDRTYCSFLGINAVHGAMSGRTSFVVTRWNDRFVHIPMELVTKGKKQINVSSNYWRAVLESTGQPAQMRSE